MLRPVTEQWNRGFTLVELMITLSVAAILVTVGIPSFMGLIASNRVAAASNDMLTVLNLAKSEAIRSGHNVILCKRNDAGDQCDSGSEWASGWLLFNDGDSDGAVSEGEQIIRLQGPLETSLGFTYQTGNQVEFTPNGQISGLGTVGRRFCFRNSYDDEKSRAVLITAAGRFRTEVRKGSNNNCDD